MTRPTDPSGEDVADVAWRERGLVRFLGRTLEDEFNGIARSLDGDVSGRKAGDDYLLTTNALYHGRPVSWALTPKIFDEAQFDILKDAAETMGRIMDRVTRRFMRDGRFRRLFRLPPALEELCRTPTGYTVPIPIARVDLFFDEETGDYTFCELNTDGSAGMTTTVEVTRAVQRTETYRQLLRKHPELRARSLDPTGAVIDAILATYDEWARARTADIGSTGADRPEMAIVDYSESASFDELKDIIRQLADRGVRAHYCDIRDLRLGRMAGRDALMTPDGPVSCVYRRAVTSEIADKPCAGTRALAQAGRLNLACVVGGFRTWPCATKTVFAVLRSQATRSILGDDERAFIERHVPQTELLDATSDLRPYQDKDDWIVKPAGGFNGAGVIAGLDCTKDEWRGALARCAAEGGVVQAYAPQYRTPMMRGGRLEAGEDPLLAEPMSNMEGLFLFRGSFSGIFTRCGRQAVIGEHTHRLNVGCLIVGKR